MNLYRTEDMIPARAVDALKKNRVVSLHANSAEGELAGCTPPNATDPALGVAVDDWDLGDLAEIVATPGSIVDIEVAAAVTAKQRLIIDVADAANKGRVKPAALASGVNEQVVGIALTAQATIGKTCSVYWLGASLVQGQ
jgi:hypothetical protein